MWCIQATVRVWRVRRQLWGYSSPPTIWTPETGVIRLGRKCLSLMSHLVGPLANILCRDMGSFETRNPQIIVMNTIFWLCTVWESLVSVTPLILWINCDYRWQTFCGRVTFKKKLVDSLWISHHTSQSHWSPWPFTSASCLFHLPSK